MKKLLFRTLILILVTVAPISAMADTQVSISLGIPLPPPVIYRGPVEVIVIPDTYLYDVYVIPDIDTDIYFCRGWWWRLWDGRWYRSRHHDRDWVYYKYTPDFYFDIDIGWREFYGNHHWRGHQWDYHRIPHHELEQNWRSWNGSRYWKKERNWDLEKYQPLPSQKQWEMRRVRQHAYAQRPDVRKHEHWKKKHQGRYKGQ